MASIINTVRIQRYLKDFVLTMLCLFAAKVNTTFSFINQIPPIIQRRISNNYVKFNFLNGLRFSAIFMLACSLIINVLFSNSVIAHLHTVNSTAKVVITKVIAEAPKGLAGQFVGRHKTHNKTSGEEPNPGKIQTLNDLINTLAKLGYHNTNHIYDAFFYTANLINENVNQLTSSRHPFILSDAPSNLSSGIFHPPKV